EAVVAVTRERPAGHDRSDRSVVVVEGDERADVVEVVWSAQQDEARGRVAGILQRKEPRSREAHRGGISDAEVDASDVCRAERAGARDERHRHVDGAPGRTAHALELAGRRAPVACDSVAVVALLVRAVSARLDDSVAAPGDLAIRIAVGAGRDGVGGPWPTSGVALLVASLDLAVAAPRLLALVRARSGRAVGRPVVAGLTRVHHPVPAQLTLLLRPGAVGRHREVVARPGGARDHAVRKRAAAPDVG